MVPHHRQLSHLHDLLHQLYIGVGLCHTRHLPGCHQDGGGDGSQEIMAPWLSRSQFLAALRFQIPGLLHRQHLHDAGMVGRGFPYRRSQLGHTRGNLVLYVAGRCLHGRGILWQDARRTVLHRLCALPLLLSAHRVRSYQPCLRAAPAD